MEIIPAILSDQAERLQSEMRLAASFAPAIHLDFADGSLTQQKTVGPEVVLESMLPLEAHLMVKEPELYLPAVPPYLSRYTTVFVDYAVLQPVVQAYFQGHGDYNDRLFQLVGWLEQVSEKRGIAFSPDVVLEDVPDELVSRFDVIQLMAVQPGAQGQAFQPAVLERCRRLKAEFPQMAIQIDGGVNLETIVRCAESGASSVVVGRAIWGLPDPAVQYECLRQTVTLL